MRLSGMLAGRGLAVLARGCGGTDPFDFGTRSSVPATLRIVLNRS
jgi:hypothetical protein